MKYYLHCVSTEGGTDDGIYTSQGILDQIKASHHDQRDWDGAKEYFKDATPGTVFYYGNGLITLLGEGFLIRRAR